MHAILPLTLALLPAQGSATGEWTALPLPAITRDGAQANAMPLVANGQHIFLAPRDRSTHESRGALVPNEVVTMLLEARAHEAGHELTLLPGGPPLLASGTESALAAAHQTLGELRSAAAGLQFRVRYWIYEPMNTSEQDLLADTGTHMEFHEGTFLPGEPIEFGERSRQPFLANYDIDVAHDSGVAAPSIGEIVTGRRLSLTAHRIAGGKRLFVQGVLDLAELESLAVFETEAPDLGIVQQPTVASLQLAFSAEATPGQPVEISIAGAPLSIADFTVRLLFEDTAPMNEPSDSKLELLDLSFLSQSSPKLPLVELAADMYFRGAAAESAFPPIPTRALTSTASDRRGTSGLYACSSAILVDLNHAESADKLKALIAGYEAGRLQAGHIEIQHGALQVRLPSTSFAPTRLIVGRERTTIRGYSAEIAPETWMPVANVERSFDGLVFDASQATHELRCGAVATRSSAPKVIKRLDANLGQLQLQQRGQIEANRTLAAGAPPSELWRKSEEQPSLTVIFSTP